MSGKSFELMKYSLENYWKNIYQKRVNDKYETQSIQSKEIIEWHKNINFYIATEFNCNPRVLDIDAAQDILQIYFVIFHLKLSVLIMKKVL